MRKVVLSQTGVSVSCMALGTLRFGTLNSFENASRLFHSYLDTGGRFIDTANSYNKWASNSQGGESETTLGLLLKNCSLRDKLFISSKVGFGFADLNDGLASDTIIRACEDSLQRLGVDHLDLYYAHKDDPKTPLEETLQAFETLKKQGKIRFAGASNYMAWRLADAEAIAHSHGWSPFTCVEQRFSYLRPAPGGQFAPQQLIDNNLETFCDRRGITMLPYTPLLRGAYVREDRPIARSYQGPDCDARLKVLKEVAHACEVSCNQVVLAWMMQRQPPMIPVFSASRVDHLEDNMAATQLKLSQEQLIRLNKAGNIANEEPN